MKIYRIALIVSLALFIKALSGPSDKVEYFFGEAHIVNLKNGVESDSTPAVLMKKISNGNKITMISTTADREGKIKEHSVNIKITGDRASVSDAENAIEGTGTVAGKPGNWNYLKLAMIKKDGTKTEDVNYLLDGKLLSRKIVSGTDGKILQLNDTDTTAISKKDYEEIYKNMHKESKATRGLASVK